MQTFAYERPGSLAEAVALLDRHGEDARVLAGGTDLVIGLRDGSLRPRVVVDLKRIGELTSAIREVEGRIVVGATTVMADISEDERICRRLPALAEAARTVGSIQIRNRATLAGNICNGSPAADTAPPLLVYGALVAIAGPQGQRTVPIDDFIVGPGRTALRRGELVTAVEVPLPVLRTGSAYTRLVRRRGTDLASVTLCVSVDETGMTRLAFGSVGPRAFLVTDETGTLADPDATAEARTAIFARMFSLASPSPRSMRAGPEYRRAMLPVLARRALQAALERLESSEPGTSHA